MGVFERRRRKEQDRDARGKNMFEHIWYTSTKCAQERLIGLESRLEVEPLESREGQGGWPYGR